MSFFYQMFVVDAVIFVTITHCTNGGHRVCVDKVVAYESMIVVYEIELCDWTWLNVCQAILRTY